MFGLLVIFNGFWSGVGTLQTPRQESLSCSKVEFRIQQTDKILSLDQGFMTCPPYKVKFKPLLLTLQAGHILKNGIVVGGIQNQVLQLNYLNENGVRVTVKSEIIDGQLNYSEQEVSPSGQVLWTIKAQLKNF